VPGPFVIPDQVPVRASVQDPVAGVPRDRRTDPGCGAVEEVIALVTRIQVHGALNVYDESAAVAAGEEPGAATRRVGALRGYLVSRWTAPAVLVGEAPGKDGARWTGVPFTSSRQLTGSGPDEPTARTVQRVLADLGLSERVLLWNASVLFAAGNRDPRRPEIDACAAALELVCRGRTVLAVGRHAERATGARYIRHPSHGGASLFAAGLRDALCPPTRPVPPAATGLRSVGTT
jgi:uracil-DNA glycosylase